MKRRLKTPVLVAVIVLCSASGIARAQGRGLTPEARQAILAYPLSLPRANQLIAALQEMTLYVVSLPDFQDRMARSMKMTPAERRAQMEKDPKTMAILKAHGLSIEDYVVGVPALRMALLAAQGSPASVAPASPANLAFAKANLSELKPKMDSADGIGRR